MILIRSACAANSFKSILIVPYRRDIRNRLIEDKRKLRCYRRRWKIERTNAWLQNFLRIQVRYDRIINIFQGLLPLRLSPHRLEEVFMQAALAFFIFLFVYFPTFMPQRGYQWLAF
jgi:hypothetical protein